MESFDVVIVGAGPVGLLTAIELALGDARVLVLERLATPSMVTKALGMGPLGSEALQRRGMAAAMDAAEARAFEAMRRWAEGSGASRFPSKFGGHFAGLSLIRRDVQREPERRARLVDQHAVEAMLTDRARQLGIDIRRACEVTGLVQRDDCVDLECRSALGNNRLRCSWLVGCDGGRSSVRKMAGFDFPGTDPTLTMYSAVVELDYPDRLFPIGWRHTSGGVFAYGPFPGRLIMLDFSGPPRDRQAPVTREEIDAVFQRISGTDIRVTALESGSRWTDNTRLVDTYRRERVLLAGDAAHIHSPFGGQGVSLGLGDAQNLGWKLAAVVRGEMPESLLDTYTAERRPVAEAVLANTLAQAAIMRPDPQSAAMRAIVADLMGLDDVNRLFGEMMSGLSVRYDVGADRTDAGRHALGRLIGDGPIGQGRSDTSLYELMHEGMGLLLDASREGEASELVAASTRRIRCVAIAEGPSLLIRPDACLAWVGEDEDVDGLDEALRRWFNPTPHHGPITRSAP